MTINQLDRRPTIRDLMLAKQDEMEASLSANRRMMPHQGEKGAAAELRWREMLSSYLPHRYAVHNGFVVDHRSNVSEQIDVIIHDCQYSPFLFKAGTSCFVPAESVYAIFDAKQEISKKSIAETGSKLASVRGLNRTSGRIWTNTGYFEGKRPEDQPILGGILAVTSAWSDPFGDSFHKALKALSMNHCLDLGVAISAGAFEINDVNEAGLIIYDKDTALVGFFMALIRKLQPLATALAMDLTVWGEQLHDDE